MASLRCRSLIQALSPAHFIGRYEARMLPGVGHNIPQEAPDETVRALLDLLESR
jgi:pimeloyl-ACP methyl ester carboxylesterase